MAIRERKARVEIVVLKSDLQGDANDYGIAVTLILLGDYFLLMASLLLAS